MLPEPGDRPSAGPGHRTRRRRTLTTVIDDGGPRRAVDDGDAAPGAPDPGAAPTDGRDPVVATGASASRPGDPRRRAAVIVLSALLLVAVVAAVQLWRSRGRAGASERAHLEWTCGNGIFWPTPDPVGGFPTGEDVWWAGHDPAPLGPIQTGQGPGSDLPRRWADGVLRFDTDDSATFVSDAGGTLVLTRQPPNRFYTADCNLAAIG